MAIRYSQYKQDSTTIGSIITWPGTTIPSGYIQCDGTTYTITASSNTKFRTLAATISGMYNPTDTFPFGDESGTGTFTVPGMITDDIIIGKDASNNLGSRIGANSASFGNTVLTKEQWPQHSHSLPRQNFNMTNSLGVNIPTNHGGYVNNPPRCPNGPACMQFFTGFMRFGSFRSCTNGAGCLPGGTSYGPRQAGSAAGMGPAVTFGTSMGSAGSANPSAHTHTTNPVQPTIRMLFLIKAF